MTADVEQLTKERDEAIAHLQNLIEAEWMVSCDRAPVEDRREVFDPARDFVFRRTQEWKDGYEAARSGLPRRTCPYSWREPTKQQHTRWHTGWDQFTEESAVKV